MQLVRCKTSDLLVPAHAEMILEGEISPDELLQSWPFGEYSGYMAGNRNTRALSFSALRIGAIRSGPFGRARALGGKQAKTNRHRGDFLSFSKRKHGLERRQASGHS